MNHTLRALFVTLALCVFAAPAFGANAVGGADVAGPAGVLTAQITVDNDVALRGVGFSWSLNNVSAATANVTAVTVLTSDLTFRRVSAVANTGTVYLAGRNGGDDLSIGAGVAVVEISANITGVTGDYANLVICGVDCDPGSVVFVNTDANPGRIDVPCHTIKMAVQADVVADIIANCPGSTYEGGSVAFHIGSTIFAGNFVSLDLISIKKNGVATVPANAPKTVGLGLVDTPNAEELITSWLPAAGEAGTWEFCYEVTNDLGNADTTCASVVVAVPGVDHAFWNGPFHFDFTPGGPFGANLNWSLTHTTDDVQGVVGPFVLTSASGGAFLDSPILGDGSMGADITAGAAYAGFASKSDNDYGNDAISADSVLGGLVSFGAAVPSPATDVVFNMAASLNDVEGIIRIDQANPPGFPPANLLSYNDPLGGTIVPTYSPGCYALTIQRNVAPTVQCPVDCTPGVGPIIFGDPVSIPGFSYNDPDAGPGPYTFSVVSIEKDGNPAVPTNAPSFAGDTFNWLTSNANQDDVGVWEFCVQVNDGADNSSNTCCFCVEVIAQVPVVCFEFGCIEDVLTGSTVCVPLTINNIDPCLELGGFDLLFSYDASVLTFQGLDMVGSVLDAADWEYLTYRIVSTNPALIRIVAIADMNNSNHHPNTLCLDGLIANVCFKVTHDQNAGCQSAHIQWYWEDCGDNTASDPTGNILYMITNPDGNPPYAGGDPVNGINGGGIISNSCNIDAQFATMEGGINGPEDFPCANPDTTKPDPVEALCFINGKIKIICPGDIDDRGDINLNGLAYEIADAVLYSNYFISGPSVFTINVAGQTAASDVNADGTPLTVADLVYLIRVITGDALPISGDLLGGGPKVSAGELLVTSAQQGANVTVSASSDADLGAGLFVFNYSGSDIAGVSAMGRASNMNVMWEAEGGQLKVLVLPRMSGSQSDQRQLVAAGNGPILNITTHGATVELVSVEAATFMGAELETQLTAKVLPTQFALQQNFPNPFNPSTSMAIDFPTASEYKLTIYNIAGQVVKTFQGNAEAGTTTIRWDAKDNRGAQVATGVYFHSVEAGAFKDVKKMVLMK
jgi:hypothetical protein